MRKLGLPWIWLLGVAAFAALTAVAVASEREASGSSAPSAPEYSTVTDLVQGGSVGNGGGVHVCRQGPVLASVELLDFYEMRDRGYVIDLGPAGPEGGDETARALYAVDRLRRFDPERAALYAERVRTFAANAIWGDYDLGPVHDTGLTQPRLGCEILKAASQLRPRTPFEKRYRLRSDLWKSMDAIQRAGLILHEVVYTDALERGHQTSRFVREVVGVMSTRLMEEFDRETYPRFMRGMAMIGYVFAGHHYFPEMKFSRAGAFEFCSEFPDNGGLSRIQFLSGEFERLRVSAIGQRIIGRTGWGTATVWDAGEGAVQITASGVRYVSAEPTLEVICRRDLGLIEEEGVRR